MVWQSTPSYEEVSDWIVFEADSVCDTSAACSGPPTKRKQPCACALTCFMAVTVITKKRGRPLVTGEVGVSIINCGCRRNSSLA